MRRIGEADLLRLVFGFFKCPAITQNPADHPESPDADCRSAMDKRRAIRRVIRDLEKLVDLLVLRAPEDDRDIEILQTEFFRFSLLLFSPMFTGLPQINNR